MNIEKKQIDALNAELTLTIAKEDYAEISRKKFAETRRNAEFKGFRKGNVPASLIQKVYGGQILADSVNKVITSSLDNYIKENNLHILGEPLGSENQPEIEWKDGNDFTFVFDIATTPEVDVDVVKEDEIVKYTITSSAKEKAEMKENMTKYYAEKNETKSEEDIEKEIAERLSANYKQQAEWRLTKDIRAFYIAKAGVQLPEAFLKRWLFTANDGKYTKEDIEKEFAGFAEDFKWQLVRGTLMKKFGFEVTEQDIKDQAAAYVTYQYAMYGLGDVPAELIQEAAQNMLKDSKQIENLAERAEDQKVLDKIKETVTFKSKRISSEKFYEL